MTRPITVAIVEDEPLARLKLRRFFADLPDFEVVGEAGDARAAVRLLETERPRLVCLDIRLPDRSGLDVLRAAPPGAAVIFTTAFDRYAVAAFELAAVDYLLKPFSRERFLVAVERARARLGAPSAARAAARLQEAAGPARLTRIFVRRQEERIPLRVAAIEYVESRDDAVIIHAEGRRFRLNITMGRLEQRLDPAMFLRIHRRLIVNLDQVGSLVPLAGSRFQARMKSGAALPVSRRRARILRDRGL